jgi:signal transduction histidine kinase
MFIILLILTLANTAIPLIILTRSRDSSGKLFSLFGLSVAAWSLGICLLYSNYSWSSSQFTFLARLASGVAVFAPFLLYVFVREFCRDENEKTTPTPIIFILGILAGAIALVDISTDLITPSASIMNKGVSVTLGSLAPLYSLFLVSLFGYCIWFLIARIRKNSGAKQSQIKIITFGLTLLVSIAIIGNVVLTTLGFKNTIWLGPLGTTALILSTAYAILARQLFDIRVIIKRTIVYSILLLAVVGVYSAVIFAFAELFGGESTFSGRSFGATIVAAALISVGLDPLKQFLQEKTDRFLFRREYEQQTVLKELSDKLNSVTGLDEALESVMQMLVRTLHLNTAITYVFQSAENGGTAIKRIKQMGFSPNKNLLLQEKDFTVAYFSTNPSITLTQNMRQELEHEEQILRKYTHAKHAGGEDTAKDIRLHARKNMVVKRLTSLDAEIVIPLQLSSQPLGLILLSGKQSDQQFTQDDLQLLELVGAQAISSIEKARLYEGDQMKSEFVSIASHELLTPIAAIEGYLSMILDEHIGVVDDQAKGYLEKVYTSSKRLSLLIKDLLSVSRIESGRMTFNFQAVDLHKLITETLDQLHIMASSKGLILRYDAPTHPLGAVRADPDRCAQVLVNLISNAIKYSNEGAVTIKARSLRGGVVVEVKDNGIGISKEQQSHLFEKFYRVDSPETAGIGGTGLGLYITRSIIEHMDSAIHVSSEIGEGTTISFSLPLFHAEASTVTT